jgi:hypothetical protein
MRKQKAAKMAADDLIRSAKSRKAPAWGLFMQSYNAHAGRMTEEEAAEALALGPGDDAPSPDAFPTFEEGIAVAQRAYENYCYREGKEPDLPFFHSILDPIHREARRARQSRHPR